MYGTIMPVHDPMPFAMPVIVPAKFGLKSIGLTIVLAVCRPCAPTEMVKNNATSTASQPAYEAAMIKVASIAEAGNTFCVVNLLKWLSKVISAD